MDKKDNCWKRYGEGKYYPCSTDGDPWEKDDADCGQGEHSVTF